MTASPPIPPTPSPCTPSPCTPSPCTPSPCTKVCILDRATGWCLGCGRTGPEIGDWPFLPEPARAALVARLPQRLAALAEARR